MCPFCIGNAVLMAGSVMSTGGLTALVVKRFRPKRETKGTVMKVVPRKTNLQSKPKEETWEK